MKNMVVDVWCNTTINKTDGSIWCNTAINETELTVGVWYNNTKIKQMAFSVILQ